MLYHPGINAVEQKATWWGLARRKHCLVPTWRGWLVLLGVLVLLVLCFLKGAYPFLAVNDLQPGGVLVVEGWASDYAFETAVQQFQAHHYERIYVTGGPLEVGSRLSAYKTYAELGVAILLKLGVSSNLLQAVPAPRVRQDRTWTSASALGGWLREHQLQPKVIQLVTEGPHARRSRLLFEKAFGSKVVVGVTAVPVMDYDPRQWWRSSAGFRNVVGETLAYVYARVFFWPRTPRAS